MKRYRFPLATVLRVRQRQEDLAVAALAASTAEERSRETRLAQVRARYAAAVAVPADAASVAQLLATRARQQHVAAGVTAARRELATARAAAGERRAEHAAAAARRDLLERLDERLRAEHADAVIGAEQREAEDLHCARRATAAGGPA